MNVPSWSEIASARARYLRMINNNVTGHQFLSISIDSVQVRLPSEISQFRCRPACVCTSTYRQLRAHRTYVAIFANRLKYNLIITSKLAADKQFLANPNIDLFFLIYCIANTISQQTTSQFVCLVTSSRFSVVFGDACDLLATQSQLANLIRLLWSDVASVFSPESILFGAVSTVKTTTNRRRSNFHLKLIAFD